MLPPKTSACFLGRVSFLSRVLLLFSCGAVVPWCFSLPLGRDVPFPRCPLFLGVLSCGCPPFLSPTSWRMAVLIRGSEGPPLCCLRLGIWLLPQRSGRLACRYCIIRLRPCVGHCPLQRCGQLDPAGESVWARSAVPSWDGTAASNSLNHMGLTTELSSAECASKLFWQLQELPKMINLLEDRKSTSERTLRWLP